MIEDTLNEITNFFEEVENKTIPIDNNAIWSIPEKSTSDSNTQMECAEILSSNIAARSKEDNYDATYLRNQFQKMDDILRNGVSEKEMIDGLGYVKPNFDYRNPRIRTKQLYNEQIINGFVQSLVAYDNELTDTKNAIQFSYILGYVGSGKSTFIKHLELSNSKDLDENDIIVSTLRYREFFEDMYSGLDQDGWNKNIEKRLLDKLVILTKRIDPECIPSSIDNISFHDVSGILFKYNLLFIIDGFDSLSANRIERRSNVRVLKAIKLFFDGLQKIYNVKSFVKKKCKVIFSLRKCTYDMLNPSTKFGRQDIKDGYFLPAANFDSVVDELLRYLSLDKDFMEKHKNVIFEIIRKTSKRVDEIFVLQRKDESADLFDNNYRRRLRYISSIVLFFALRVSNDVTGKTHNELHSDFFDKLKRELTDHKNDHWYYEILIYGLNHGYNNYFSNSEEEDNRGASCGFVDNIFCYFKDKLNESENNRKKIILSKLRILQLLHTNYSDCRFQYLSIQKIKSELIRIGIDLSNSELCETLDFLEKSLFIRSSYPYETLQCEEIGGEEEGCNGDELPNYFELKTYFKCSNFGCNLIENILFSYTYMTAVSQNSCLPEDYSKLVKYKTKLKHSEGKIFFIDNEWIKEVIPNTLLFFLVMRSVEQSNLVDKELHVFGNILKSFRGTLTRMSGGSIKSKLSEDEISNILERCKTIMQIS